MHPWRNTQPGRGSSKEWERYGYILRSFHLWHLFFTQFNTFKWQQTSSQGETKSLINWSVRNGNHRVSIVDLLFLLMMVVSKSTFEICKLFLCVKVLFFLITIFIDNIDLANLIRSISSKIIFSLVFKEQILNEQ